MNFILVAKNEVFCNDEWEEIIHWNICYVKFTDFNQNRNEGIEDGETIIFIWTEGFTQLRTSIKIDTFGFDFISLLFLQQEQE